MLTYYEKVEQFKKQKTLKISEIAEILEVDDDTASRFYGAIIQFSSLIPVDNDQIVNEVEVPNNRDTWQEVALALMTDIGLENK